MALLASIRARPGADPGTTQKPRLSFPCISARPGQGRDWAAPSRDWTSGGVCPSLFPVANSSKSAGQNHPAKAGLPFEEALKKLETVVEAMEGGELPLEQLVARYEEGMKLARICQEKLAEAELKIQQLEKTAAGEIRRKPLDLPEE